MDHPQVLSPLRFALSGPVQAWLGDSPLDLGPPQRRAVLAMLVLGVGRAISPDALVDGIWADRPPARPLAAVQAHISVLRRVLEPTRAPREPSAIVRSVGRNYVVDVVGVEVDLFLFRHRLAAARAARSDGHADRAVTMLRAALDGWDGVALVGLPGPVAALHRDALLDERLTAFEELVELQLDRTPDGVASVELAATVAQHPHRERLHALRMRLLHRQGRRADALGVYAEVRDMLVDDLGIEPGPELRRAQREILDDAATAPAGLPAVRRAPAAAPAPAHLIGRDREVAAVAAALESGPGRPVVVHGMAGIGTSAVGRAAVARVAPRFGAGVHTRLGPGRAPAGSLLVLDGVRSREDLETRLGARPGGTAHALRALADDGVTVLVTAANRLRHAGGVRRIEIPSLTLADSRRVLASIIGEERVAREPEAVDEMLGWAGGLTAAVVGNAEQLAIQTDWGITPWVQHLRNEAARDPFWLVEVALGPIIGHAFAGLDELETRVLCAAARLPGDCTQDQMEAVLGRERWVLGRLQRLMEAHLLDSPGPGRYRFHPLLREYAVGLASSVDPERAARCAGVPASLMRSAEPLEAAG